MKRRAKAAASASQRAAVFHAMRVMQRFLLTTDGLDLYAGAVAKIFGVLCLNTAIAALGFISAGSMMADVAEQHELDSGRAQQGIFFSATSFSGKLASGLGHAAAGIGLDLIAFPLKADPSQVPIESIRALGMLNLLAALLTLGAIYVFSYYSITRAHQARTRQALEARSP